MQFPQSLNRSQLPLFEAFLGTHLPLLDEAVQSPWLDEPEPFSELRLSGSLGNCRHLLGPVLRELSLAPTYMSHQTTLVLARDLYPQRLPGDEPEELEVVPWKLAELDQLMLREDFSEGRSLAALFIARQWLAMQA